MLYYDFQNYEEFKELFGIVEHGNGVKSRKNKILLALYRDKAALKRHIARKEYESLNSLTGLVSWRDDRCCDGRDTKNFRRWHAIWLAYVNRRDNCYVRAEGCLPKTMPAMKRNLYELMHYADLFKGSNRHTMNLMGRKWFSDSYKTDGLDGLCEDGTLNAIRYVSVEKNKPFKMRAGKLFKHLVECNSIVREMPYEVRIWLGEEFAAEWTEYARQNLGDDRYTLHVDDDFCSIYDSERCAGYDEDSDSFGSCMVDDDQWTFYRDAVDAKAAYLTDEDDMIVARCIVFTDVTDQDGKKWRLAERQYSADSEPTLQRQLVNALYRGGHIDGHKRVGASCGDSRGFVAQDGSDLSDRKFRIHCRLEDGDTLSYQDSFKNYNPDTETATNYGVGDVELDITDSRVHFSRGEWSSYNEERIPEDDAEWVETREDFFWHSQTVRAYVRDRYDGSYHMERCFEDDCVPIHGDYYYAGDDAESPEEYGICCCPKCDEYFIADDACHSELTEEDYCCESCREDAEEQWKKNNGWAYSEYDGEWYEDSDDVLTVWHWRYHYICHVGFVWGYDKTTISVESFNDLVEDGDATEFCGRHYIDALNFDGEPVHLGSMSAAA